MKKLLLIAALGCFAASSAQMTTTTTSTTTKPNGKTYTSTSTKVYDGKHTISAYGSFPELNQAGLSVEFFGNKESKTMDSKSWTMYTSKVVNVAYGMMNYEFPTLIGERDVDGEGVVVDLGMRNYFSGKGSGAYFANYLSFGNIKFDDTYEVAGFTQKFEGRYRYFSFFSPEIGYKIKAGPVAIDPFVGVMWRLEIKGRGDIDNNNTDEWVPRVGLKLGVEF